jgi:hypothetical protein
VVVVEGEGQDRHLKLFGHCKKKERSAAAPPTYQYVQIPAMVPAATPCAPAAGPPCAAPPNACGRQAGTALENATGIVAAGQDLRATIDHLKALRAQREAEIAVIDAALAGASPTAPRQGVKAVTVSNPGPTRNEIAELSDKIDYLAALIDALAGDLKNSDPKRQLPAFDELNGLRKPKP